MRVCFTIVYIEFQLETGKQLSGMLGYDTEHIV